MVPTLLTKNFFILPILSFLAKAYTNQTTFFMRRIFLGLFLLVISVLFSQCQKEISHSGGTVANPAVPNPITAIIQGNVTDENGQPTAGATIKVGSQSATTNAQGYFRIRNAVLDKNASLVTAEQSGYFKAYRTFSATAGVNQVAIKLIKKNLSGTVDASTGGSVTLSTGGKVTLPAGGVVKESSGAAYTGTINVYAAYIDPTASDIAEVVPGSFIANDKDGNRVMLKSFGMMAVELESTAGEKLQIKGGSKANLTTPIPTSVQAAAPATIPLWYVDEATGIWKEEGNATKQGTVYVGEVSHFSFWNCDISIPAIQLTLTLHNGEGHPVVHAKVKISRTNITTGLTQSYGVTDSLGQVSGLVPANENLSLEALNNCNETFYNQNIGPFSAATNLGTIVVATGSTSLVTFKGKLTTCAGTPVTNGFAIISYGITTRYARVNAAGEYTTTFTRCATSPDNANVTGVDAGTGQQSTSATSVAVVTPITNAAPVAACGTTTAQFINYTIDGTTYNLTAPADSIVAYSYTDSLTSQIRTSINGMRISGGILTHYINLDFVQPTAVAGTYTASSFKTQGFTMLVLTPPFNVILTNYPTAPGAFYEGSFSGSFTQSGVSHTASGAFRIRR